MRFFTLEHSRATYVADFALYGTAVVLVAAYLLLASPPALARELQALTLLGLLSWSSIEYALHRFVLHGMQPFRRWHAEHHRRPTALICAPTLLSASLIGGLVFLPMLLLGTAWHACGLTLGVMMGYLFYALSHHAIHHARIDHIWLRQRRYGHALHHGGAARVGCYGVTSTFWDQVLGTYLGRVRTRRRAAWDIALATCLILTMTYELSLAWLISPWWCFAASLFGAALIGLRWHNEPRHSRIKASAILRNAMAGPLPYRNNGKGQEAPAPVSRFRPLVGPHPTPSSHSSNFHLQRGYAMNPVLAVTVLLSTLSLFACERPIVITTPATPVAVPGPAGPQGATGSQGADGNKGATGTPGDASTTVIVTPAPPPEHEPEMPAKPASGY